MENRTPLDLYSLERRERRRKTELQSTPPPRSRFATQLRAWGCITSTHLMTPRRARPPLDCNRETCMAEIGTPLAVELSPRAHAPTHHPPSQCRRGVELGDQLVMPPVCSVSSSRLARGEREEDLRLWESPAKTSGRNWWSSATPEVFFPSRGFLTFSVGVRSWRSSGLEGYRILGSGRGGRGWGEGGWGW